MKTVVIEIVGGAVNDVYADGEKIQVVVLDYDAEGSTEDDGLTQLHGQDVFAALHTPALDANAVADAVNIVSVAK